MSWQCGASGGAQCLQQHIVHHPTYNTITLLIIVLQTIGPEYSLLLPDHQLSSQSRLAWYNLPGYLPKNHYFQYQLI